MEAQERPFSQPVIEAQHLRKSFGVFTAVDDISFAVSPGECFGILGPNGAGKTTAIRMLYGFSPMTGGTLRIFGLDVQRDLRAIKARIGVCQQENALDPDLTVLQNMEIFAGYFGLPRTIARKRAEELLSFIALDQRRNDKVIEISGGMMRRLVLARALINNPDLLILDEPHDRAGSAVPAPGLATTGGTEKKRLNHSSDHALHGRGLPVMRSADHYGSGTHSGGGKPLRPDPDPHGARCH